MAATGAFLLLAGAAVFVAVRWDQLPDMAKLVLVCALTAAFLVGGRALRRTLPATGDVLFHLGAFLLPVDLAGLALRSSMGWRPLLLAEGLLGVAALGGLGMATRSVVLTWAGAASVAVSAAGLAAVSPAPAPLVLALAAVAAEVSARRRLRAAAWPWAAAAGLAPVLGAAATVVLGVGLGTLADLGLAGAGPAAAAVTGALSAFVLARQARAHDDLRLAFLALVSVVVALLGAWFGVALPAGSGGVGLAALFVSAEVAALLGSGDPFWARPLALAARLAEAPAGAAAFCSGVVLLAAPFAGSFRPEPVWSVAMALLGLGFIVADGRRYGATARPFRAALLGGGSWAPATVAVAATVAAAVQLGTASAPATALVLLAIAAVAGGTRRPGAEVVAATFAPWAVVVAGSHAALAGSLGLAGAAVVAERAVRRHRQSGATPVGAVLAWAAVVTALIGLAAARPALGPVAAAAAAVPSCWLLALQLDRASGRLGDAARLALVLPVLHALGLSPGAAIPVLLGVTVLLGTDAVRLVRPRVGVGSALAAQGLVAEVALAAGISGPAIGVALCVAAVVWVGLATVVEGGWRLPFTVAALSGLGLGLVVASADAGTFANALLIAGGLAVAAGLSSRLAPLAHVGGVLCTAGVGIHLSILGVQAAEPYATPVAAQLLLAGVWARRQRPSTTSWVAYVPSVALLGGVAMLERLAGGAGWHALVAGAVGTTAVAAGGWRRLAGPMLAGTALLVAVTLHESLAAIAGVPTWAWLTLGGSVLLAVGIALERSDTSPVEAGRRVVDVVAERFV